MICSKYPLPLTLWIIGMGSWVRTSFFSHQVHRVNAILVSMEGNKGNKTHIQSLKANYDAILAQLVELRIVTDAARIRNEKLQSLMHTCSSEMKQEVGLHTSQMGVYLTAVSSKLKKMQTICMRTRRYMVDFNDAWQPSQSFLGHWALHSGC